MSTIQRRVATWSSIALRIATYVFLRIIPGHPFPPVIYTLFALYVPSFIASHITQTPYNVVEDDINITVTEVEREDQPSKVASTAAQSQVISSSEETEHVKEEVEVNETVVIQEKSSKPLRTLLTGAPDPRSILLSLFTFLINVALVLATIDLVYHAKVFHPSTELSFARMGYIAPTEANILVREPDISKLPISVTYQLATPAANYEDPKPQLAGTIHTLSEDTDFTQALKFPLPNHPERTYQWTTSNNHTGFFTTPPKPGHLPQSGSFTFFTSSCIKPRFPYSPFDHALAIPGFRHMANVIKSIPGGSQFMLFLGDFIYIDVPKRFGVSVEDYRREYRQVYSSPDWPAVGQNLSWIHVLDDHEIANDWDQKRTGIYEAAADPWHHYQTAVNPPRARQAGTYNTLRDGATYFEFTQGPASFFLMDTRTYRDSSSDLPANSTGKSMLGAQQLADLLGFLKKPEPKGVKWKIVASSIPFTKNWRVNSMDTWAGYLSERQIILEAMWDVGLRGGCGVVIISGDRHEFAATAFPPPLNGRWPVSATVNEFSTSPLSQFYLPVHTYWQADDEDIEIKYIPGGNSKLGAITIENAASDQSTLRFRLYVDGHEAWSSILLSPPVISGGRWIKDSLWG
ncbi:hypothetical protein MFRU_001g00030 [Monilinia fructicola]|uniref:PhoD-like phosphatase metallophosphatase domain-containing protein n=1 Tax=Monilinia fructicola TaxID=38448 RepID=A0A5M9JYG2_MONFR|nr:hypothetical protein EYC84_005760 [Monilinia fructicola]KAG4035232.1 hypothetical protein MFRU_001g00030 [Monilinia fructicola]